MKSIDNLGYSQNHRKISTSTKVRVSSWKSRIIYLSLIMLCIFIVQCSKKEQAPFFDGLYLEYDVLKTYKTRDEAMLNFEGTKEHWKVTYSVEAIDNGKYKVIQNEFNARNERISHETVFHVDAYGMAQELGNYLQFWVPITGFKTGDALYDKFKVNRKETWKGCNVLVFKDESIPVTDIGAAEWYYDERTGFMVGKEAHLGIKKVVGSQEQEWLLIDTNADVTIPENEDLSNPF